MTSFLLTRLGWSYLAVAALGHSARATTTWIVDDGGGPGVDFTNVGAAIAAAQPGDVILVQPGSYPGFAVDKGVSVLGSAGVSISGSVQITAVPAGPRAVITKMSMQGLRVVSCAATALITDVVTKTARFDDSTDVRVRASTIGPSNISGETTVEIQDTRVELTHSMVRTSTGMDGSDHSASDAGHGIVCGAGAQLHLSLSSVFGGEGGSVYWTDPPTSAMYGGDGGHAILVTAGACVLATGTETNELRGGNAGWGVSCFTDGAPGAGLHNLGSAECAQHSRITIIGGYQPCHGYTQGVVGPHVIADPIDPALAVSGSVALGSPVVFTLHGAPGDSARLRLGRQPVVQDIADVLEDRLVLPLRTFDLGVIPSSGQVQFTFNVPSALPYGFLIVAQGNATSPSGATRLTQSTPLALR